MGAVTKNIRGTYLFAKASPMLFMRMILIFLILFFVLTYITIDVLAANKEEKDIGYYKQSYYSQKNNVISSLNKFEFDQIEIAETRKLKEEQRLLEIQAKLAVKQGHIDRINAFLVRKNSPVANTNIPSIIYEYSVQYGSDYKVLLAIMGVESGFCAQAFYYNCFGYINGVHYSSYETAFRDIVPKVFAQYVNRYGTNFTALAKSYGMINWEKGASNLAMYYSQI